jgi:hypothetical protein
VPVVSRLYRTGLRMVVVYVIIAEHCQLLVTVGRVQVIVGEWWRVHQQNVHNLLRVVFGSVDCGAVEIRDRVAGHDGGFALRQLGITKLVLGIEQLAFQYLGPTTRAVVVTDRAGLASLVAVQVDGKLVIDGHQAARVANIATNSKLTPFLHE